MRAYLPKQYASDCLLKRGCRDSVSICNLAFPRPSKQHFTFRKIPLVLVIDFKRVVVYFLALPAAQLIAVAIAVTSASVFLFWQLCTAFSVFTLHNCFPQIAPRSRGALWLGAIVLL